MMQEQTDKIGDILCSKTFESIFFIFLTLMSPFNVSINNLRIMSGGTLTARTIRKSLNAAIQPNLKYLES